MACRAVSERGQPRDSDGQGCEKHPSHQGPGPPAGHGRRRRLGNAERLNKALLPQPSPLACPSADARPSHLPGRATRPSHLLGQTVRPSHLVPFSLCCRHPGHGCPSRLGRAAASWA